MKKQSYIIHLHDLIKRTTSREEREKYFQTIDIFTAKATSKALENDKELLLSPDREGKLNGVSVLRLSINCGRAVFLQRMINLGLIASNTRICSCYTGEDGKGGCWQEYTTANRFQKKREGLETIAEYRPQVVDATSIGKAFKPGKKAYRETILYREGQAGDSSHAFMIQPHCGYSPAFAWLNSVRASGLNVRTVFISAAYAPVKAYEYRDLVDYKELFTLHFSLSGWFQKEEIDLRLAQFLQARECGLDPIIRRVTNKDRITCVDMPNDSYLDECLAALGVDRAHILETPFHDDSTHTRSKASLPGGPVCCETGKCKTCKFACGTK